MASVEQPPFDSPTATMEFAPDFNISRGYQLEMFEASIKANTIVVMDTGSGKTHVAILRIMYELEHSKNQKLIWFLAPTVPLCVQQAQVLQENIPSISMRLIIGSDKVERWKDQDTWNDLLGSHRLIVSTHAILADALDHGFVTVQQLGLLIFDEAHHCSLSHPANRIMKTHYHPSLRIMNDVPSILGLTASPIMTARASLESLRLIETNLDAVATTPRVHLDELRSFVHLPKLIQVQYPSEENCGPQLLSNIRRVLFALLEDPRLDELVAPRICENVTIDHAKRRTHDDLQRFLRQAEHVNLQLGAWACTKFILLVTRELEAAVSRKKQLLLGWRDDEMDYLCKVLSLFNANRVSTPATSIPMEVSEKFTKMIALFDSPELSKSSGIIFVEQRATAAVLRELLAVHPKTKHLNCRTFVGISGSANRRTAIGDLLDTGLQSETLQDFRDGKCDFIIATSVLEEGIDISSCNLIICFDKPSNLKSFIQRRGRARDRKSHFIIMTSDTEPVSKKVNWAFLEAEMKRSFQDEARNLEIALHRETIPEHVPHRFEVEATGAVLTFETAIPHLNHFCAVLPHSKHVVNRPIFTLHEVPDTELIWADVLLPNSVDVTLRRSLSSQAWQSQRRAQMDAAFHAYISLYKAGLVNDNLLPTPRLPLGLELNFEDFSPVISVSQPMNPWVEQARAWKLLSSIELQPYEVIVERPQKSDINMTLLLPNSHLGSKLQFKLHWDSSTTYALNVKKLCNRQFQSTEEFLAVAQQANQLMLKAIHFRKMNQNRSDLFPIFLPSNDYERTGQWLEENQGSLLATTVRQVYHEPPYRLVSTLGYFPHLFQRWVENEDALEVLSFRRRRNFLHDDSMLLKALEKEHSPTTRIFPLEGTTFDRISSDAIEFALLVPSLLHCLEKQLVVNHLCTALLKPVQFSNTRLVLEALTASYGYGTRNYQRLEFIGDSALKFIVGVQLFATHSKWHEGYLSNVKDSMVSNSRLARAALDTGLGQFVFTDPFSPRKWRPMYLEDLLEPNPESERQMATKVLADVVEALFGAALLDGGFQSALRCINLFLKEVKVQGLGDTVKYYLENSQQTNDAKSTARLEQIQHLLGYNFHNQSHLLSALTHASLISDTTIASYQRLEFLGDAILDMVVVQCLATYSDPPLSHIRMHEIKSALVNADFLGLLCLEIALEEELFDIKESKVSRGTDGSDFVAHSVRKVRRIPLCDFMRYSSSGVTRERQSCGQRWSLLSQSIQEAVSAGIRHPWALLAQMGLPKFFSDIIEAIFGAVFIDSGGNLKACTKLAEQLGILSYLRRMVNEKVEARHPKTLLGILVGKMAESDADKKGDDMDTLMDAGDEYQQKRKKVKYHVVNEDEGTIGYRCSVSVGMIVYGEVREALTKEEATTRAADIAVEALGGYKS